MSWIRLFPILFMGVLLIGCSRSQSNEERLKRAEQIVENSPYEAADILDSIEPSKLGRKQRADFEILRGEIRYRLDSVMVGGDSLLGIATDYYDTQLENPKNSRAHFLRAYELQTQGRRPEAIVELFHAERSAAGAGDTLALGLIYRSISDYFRQMEDNGTALTYAQKAYEMFHAIQSDKYTPWALYDLARAYGNVFNHRKAIEILEECRNLYFGSDDIYLERAALILLGRQYLYLEEYNEAKAVYDYYLTNLGDIKDARIWLSLGRVYLYMNDIEAARQCQDSLQLLDPEETFLKLGIAECTKDYEICFKLISQEILEQNKVLDKVYKRDYASIINGYFLKEIKLSDEKRAKEEKLRYIISLICILIVIIAVLVLRWINIKRKNERETAIASIRVLEENLRNNTVFINNLQEEKDSRLMKARTIVESLLSTRIKEAEKLCHDYEMAPGDKRQNSIYLRISEILNEMKSGSAYLGELESTINHLMDDIMINFRNDYPNLSNREYTLFLFMLLGFSTNIICLSQSITPNHYYAMKSKLKKKITSNGEVAFKYLSYF